MKNLNPGLKILIIVLIALFVIAAAVAVLYFVFAAEPDHAVVDEQYRAAERLDLSVELSVTPAPTPEPTPAPTPEPTPEGPDEHGFYPAAGTVTVTGDCVNVRSEPNTDCEVVGTAVEGQELTQTGYNDDGWVRIDYNGDDAYISADYVE